MLGGVDSVEFSIAVTEHYDFTSLPNNDKYVVTFQELIIYSFQSWRTSATKRLR